MPSSRPARTWSSALAVDALDLAGVRVDADHGEPRESAHLLTRPRERDHPVRLRGDALAHEPDLDPLRREVDLSLGLCDRLVLVEAERGLLAGLSGHEREYQRAHDHG